MDKKRDAKEKQPLRVGILGRSKLGMRTKLTGLFLIVKIVPIIVLTVLAFYFIFSLAMQLRDIAVYDSTQALNERAIENIERLSTDTALEVADFLYGRDDDILYATKLYNNDLSAGGVMETNLRDFLESKTKRVVKKGEWVLAKTDETARLPDNEATWIWVRKADETEDGGQENDGTGGGRSTNEENNKYDWFHYRDPDKLEYEKMYLYDEITYFEADGNGDFIEKVKVTAKNGTDENGEQVRAGKNGGNGLDDRLFNLSEPNDYGNYKNTFCQAEDYPSEIGSLSKGKIYVSDVIGEYVGTNYNNMYTPSNVASVAANRDDPTYSPEKQAYAGEENPNGKRFEGIVRWVTPVYDGDVKIGYISIALNHDHIMEMVDHITPMDERYTELPSAYEGNYAFIWDYQCRSICHPRHYSIAGYDAATGNPQIPWLEQSTYNAYAEWEKTAPEFSAWDDYVLNNFKPFRDQSLTKKNAAELTRKGLIGLDGRYLDSAPQCTGWMDLTLDGGSGSFYIEWMGIPKLTTAATIPYYTGKYAYTYDHTSDNYGFNYTGNKGRGFGFVAIGAGLESFTAAAEITKTTLNDAINEGLSASTLTLALTVAAIILIIIFIAIWVATSLTRSIKDLNNGMTRFQYGERQFRFKTKRRDEFGSMADSFDDMADAIDDSVKNPLSITDMDHNLIYMNEPALKLCNTTLDKVVGTAYRRTSVYPANSEYDPITALEAGREAEIYYSERNGRYLQGVANYITGADGSKKGYIIESRDITDMVKRRQMIEQQKRLLDEVFAASPDLIWYTDASSRFLTVNPRFAKTVGLEPDDFTGKYIDDILTGDKFRRFIENDKKAVTENKPVYSDDKLLFADGHAETLESVRTPIIDEAGQIVGMLGFARNITERVRIENELRKTQLELENAVELANSASQHKGDFLARMSHEIRTPMNAVIGITDIILKKLGEMKESADIKEIKSYMGQIDNSSKHLLGLLNDVLDISKIEAGKIELSDEVVSLSKMLSTVAGIIRPRCGEKNLKLVTDFDEFKPDTFKFDSLRLRQVLINLLGNAVKFTNECGIIKFSAKLARRSGGRALVRFAVSDTGIGIAKEMQTSIFEAFEQAGRGITRKYGGTGLGLAISRRIVQLFGGDIKLVSELGEGSEFSFEIYLTETDAKPADESEINDISGKFAGKRILLVDDVDINRMIVRAMLETTEMNIDEANDGQMAVDIFSVSPLFYYDLILMDIKMPNLDGYEASDLIRATDRADAKNVPIIALTANAFKEDIQQALAHGMNEHISKPIESHVLYSLLFKYLGK